ncbi:MAG: hypothetical protein ACRCTO_23110 [Pseudomonas paracarnis]
MAMIGRPPTSKLTDEQKLDFADAIAEGDSMRVAAVALGLERKAIWRAMEEDAEFRASIARAREIAGEAHADRANEVIAKVESGELDPAAGRVVLAGLQWQAAKQAPKRFSDRQVIAGEKDNPLLQATDEQVDARIAELLAKKGP